MIRSRSRWNDVRIGLSSSGTARPAEPDERTAKGEKTANPDFLVTGDAAMVRFQPTKPMAIEQMDTFPELSRFAIRDMGKTVAAGVCMKIEKK